MQEQWVKFEEWTMTSLVLLSVLFLFGGKIFFSELSSIDGSKIGFTVGLITLLLMGSLCLFVSRLQSVVAFWLLIFLSASFLISIPIFILWNVFPPLFTLTLIGLFGCYFRGLFVILSDARLISQVVY